MNQRDKFGLDSFDGFDDFGLVEDGEICGTLRRELGFGHPLMVV